MKTTVLSLGLLLYFTLSNAGEKEPNKSITKTTFGSFGSIKVDGQTDHDDNDKTSAGASSTVQYTQSSFKTADGGTASFVKFNTKPAVVVVKSKSHVETSKKVITEKPSLVSVYPNPSNGDMTIKYFIPKNEKAEFAIYDLAGKKLTSYFLVGEKNQLTISEEALSPGIYFYNVVSNGKIVMQDKIVIIK